MSEFKFACPVCGQHITADSEASGRHLECPTCFRKMVVPQPPALPDSKLILAAAQVAKPRPTAVMSGHVLAPARSSAAPRAVAIAAVLLLLGGGATAAWVLRPKPAPRLPPGNSPRAAQSKEPVPFPIPANITWSLEANDLVFPLDPASGALLGNGFKSEKASIQGGVLSLRQGKRWAPELILNLALSAREPEELSGRTLEFAANHAPPLPRISIRWKDEASQPQKQEFAQGYALRISFGQVAKGRLPGQIYLCLPDPAKSVVAGTFEAEIKHPPPPKAQPNQAPWPP